MTSHKQKRRDKTSDGDVVAHLLKQITRHSHKKTLGERKKKAIHSVFMLITALALLWVISAFSYLQNIYDGPRFCHPRKLKSQRSVEAITKSQQNYLLLATGTPFYDSDGKLYEYNEVSFFSWFGWRKGRTQRIFTTTVPGATKGIAVTAPPTDKEMVPTYSKIPVEGFSTAALKCLYKRATNATSDQTSAQFVEKKDFVTWFTTWRSSQLEQKNGGRVVKVMTGCGVAIGYFTDWDHDRFQSNTKHFPFMFEADVQYNDNVKIGLYAVIFLWPLLKLFITVALCVWQYIRTRSYTLPYVETTHPELYRQVMDIGTSIKNCLNNNDITSFEDAVKNLDRSLSAETVVKDKNKGFFVTPEVIVILHSKRRRSGRDGKFKSIPSRPFITVIPIDSIAYINGGGIFVFKQGSSEVTLAIHGSQIHYANDHSGTGKRLTFRWLVGLLKPINQTFRKHQTEYEERLAKEEQQRRRREMLLLQQQEYLLEEKAYRDANPLNVFESHTAPSTPEMIAQVLSKGYVAKGNKAEKASDELLLCTICQDDLVHDEFVVHFPCKEQHAFHAECLRGWMRQAHTCPLCRHSVEHVKPPEIDSLHLRMHLAFLRRHLVDLY